MTIHSRVTKELRRFRAPALAAGVVDAEGRLEYAVAGVRRRGSTEAVTDSDRWHLGSCGKSMTAATYARLVEAGLAQWSAPLTELFADLELHPGWAAVTIDDLLLNRSGAPANLSLGQLRRYWRDQRPLTDQRTELAAAMFARAPKGPGRFRYSNLGYTVAGAAIERITGGSYETALQRHLLTPLGITTAGFGPPPEIKGHKGRIRLGNLIVGRGPARDPAVPQSDNPAVITPAGRMHLTIEDWSRFQRVWLAGADGAGVLTEASVQRLLTVPPGNPYAMGWAPARGLPNVSVGQQGSNTYWMATALLDRDRRRSAMVIVNDGRTSMFYRTAHLAAQLLTG